MNSNGTLNNHDKVLYDRGFKRATSALGKTETVILKGESHKIITTPTLLSSASREHDPSVGSIAVYSNDKMTIRTMLELQSVREMPWNLVLLKLKMLLTLNLKLLMMGTWKM